MRRVVVLILAIASFSWFVWDTSDRGWSRPSTDFPNYYTAAMLVRGDQPLRHYYDWTWFQRQMHYTGIDHQLGGYIPQTPLTMAPYIPLSFFSPLPARRIWLVLNFLFLGLTLWLLSRITRFTIAELWILSLPGYFALRSNFELGQYYIFLLCLLTLAVYYLLRRRELAGGMLLGASAALKLYAAPILLFAACGRRWRIVSGMALALLLSIICAVSLFGWKEVGFFVTQVLSRALAGETLNPYHPSNGTATTMLRRLFVAEPQLNPTPLTDSPVTFFFLATLIGCCVTLLPAAAATLRSGAVSKRSLAWWLLGMLLASSNTASYTFALMILPTVLLLDDLPGRDWLWIVSAYFLVTLPLAPVWSWIFPKVWLLLALFLRAGWPDLKLIPVKTAMAMCVICLLVGTAVAGRETWRSRNEPRERIRTKDICSEDIYSSSPSVSPAGLLFEAIDGDRYVIHRNKHTFRFDGDAFHPVTPDSGIPIFFELVAGNRSTIMRFGEQPRRSEAIATGVANPQQPAISHNGTTLAFVSDGALYEFGGHASRRIADSARDPSFLPGDLEIVYASGANSESIRKVAIASGVVTTLVEDSSEKASPSISPGQKHLLFARRESTWQIWTKDLATGKEVRITGGNCNNTAPAWNGLREIIFASDCRRGLGLPALFRASLQ